MSDSYQAVYDATRSRIRGCDTSEIIREVASQCFDFSSAVQTAISAITAVEIELTRPSTIYRPRLSIDGNQWCALYGDNLQDGVAGFGDSPDGAMRDFDAQWSRKLAKG